MNERKGIILAGGSGTRLFPLTIAISKQMMPVYDKPMIYYPLSVLMLSGIREILIISTPQDLPLFEKLLGNGSRFGIELHYMVQPKPEGLAQAFIIGNKFIGDSPSALILGDNLFYGSNFTEALQIANKNDKGATVFGHYVSNPNEYGVIEFNSHRKAISIEEKPENPKSNFAVPGLYFYDSQVCDIAANLKPSSRGELEITDVNRIYMDWNQLNVELLGRGTAWLDTGSHDNLIEAGNFVQTIENRQGLKIACLEEIAFKSGWISLNDLQESVKMHGKTAYAKYLNRFIS